MMSKASLPPLVFLAEAFTGQSTYTSVRGSVRPWGHQKSQANIQVLEDFPAETRWKTE